MPIAVLFLIIVGGGTIAVLFPRLRWPAAGISVAFALLFGAYLVTTDFSAPASPSAISPEELELSDLVFDDTPGTANLSGRVRNLSPDQALSQFEVLIRLYDCTEPQDDPAAASDSCVIIAEDIARARVPVPPGQVRQFLASFGFANRPAAQGVLVWQESVAAVTTRD